MMMMKMMVDRSMVAIDNGSVPTCLQQHETRQRAIRIDVPQTKRKPKKKHHLRLSTTGTHLAGASRQVCGTNGQTNPSQQAILTWFKSVTTVQCKPENMHGWLRHCVAFAGHANSAPQSSKTNVYIAGNVQGDACPFITGLG